MQESRCQECGKVTVTPTKPNRIKKFCNNKCQAGYRLKQGFPLPEGVTKELLLDLYENKQKSVLSISKVIGKAPTQVSRYLKKCGIKARSFSTKGIKTWQGRKHSEETKEKIRSKAIGREIPLEVRMKMGSKGEKNPGYIDGRTPINRGIRHSAEYSFWRKSVFTRDNWTCVFCGKRGGNIEADHIAPFAYYPELRFSVDNGRTLCRPCHMKTDTFGGRKGFKK